MRKLFVILAVAVLAFAFTVPARAEVSFYGFIRFATYMKDVSKEAAPGGAFDDSDLVWKMDDGDSRFGARFKNGDFSATVELRPRSDALERQWNAAWNFGAGTLSIGHMWSPEFSCITGSGYGPGTLGGYGDPGCTVRDDMIQLSIGGLKLALVAPYTAGVGAPPAGAGTKVTGAGADIDTTIPKLAASYLLNVGPAAIKLFGGYQTYAEVDTATDKEVDIGAYLIGASVSAAFGPAYAKAVYWMGQNEGVYTRWPYRLGTAHGPNYVAATDTLTDADNSAYVIVLGYNISETMKIEGGYVASKYECDAGLVKEDTNSAYYVNLPIKLASNFTVTPEILFLDNEDKTLFNGNKVEEGDTTIYGVAWVITF